MFMELEASLTYSHELVSCSYSKSHDRVHFVIPHFKMNFIAILRFALKSPKWSARAFAVSVCLWLYSHFVGSWPLFQFLILYIVGRTPGTGDQPVARPLPTPRTTQTQNKHTDIHALSGIRTYDPSVRASEDSSCLRPRGHYDRPRFYCTEYRMRKYIYITFSITNT
jgi:hypothetical protein